MTYNNELWKTITFENKYEVSNLGNVRHVDTKRLRKLSTDKDGYLRLTLYPSWRSYRVQRLVAKMWLPEFYEEHLQVDHLNAVRTDNRVVNLEWVTLQENVDRIPPENRKDIRGSNNPAAVITEAIALDIKYDFDRETVDIAFNYGIRIDLVESIRRRERWVHVVDEDKELLYQRGELTYKKGKTANLSKGDVLLLELDISEGLLTTKMMVNKYGVSKSAVCRRRRNQQKLKTDIK